MALLEASDVTKHFSAKRSAFGGSRGIVRAVDGISFAIEPGKTLGVVGESGCGKTTTSNLVLGLEAPTSGVIKFEGRDLASLDAAGRRNYRKSVQAVFQDPYASLNPRMRISDIIAEPLVTNETVAKDALRRRVLEVLDLVGLPARAADLFPHEFSGGQRQRIAIARALSLRPDLIVADEITSGLDVTVKLRVLALLRELQVDFHLAYLFISHDLGVVRQVADRVAVMYLGQIVEEAPTDRLFERPLHPYTQVLQASVPPPDPSATWRPPALAGDPPSPLSIPPGCRFHPRCPIAEARCRVEPPALRALGPAHRVACHLAT